MIVLDTNIISETVRDVMNRGVEVWFDSQPGTSLFTTTITQAELWVGVRRLAASKRRDQLNEMIAGLLNDFGGRILTFDEAAADHYADILVARQSSGRPISQSDCQIAAITRSRGARLATRNERDFVDCGIEIVNPFS